MSDASFSPRVSVIVPFLNPGDFLQDAISSVLAQKYQSWELLLVDDGSTDQSTGIARQFSESSGGQIRYIEHPGHANRGMPASRNLGIVSSRGVYVANLDADDTWDDTFLEEFVSILERHPSVAMTFGPMRIWTSWSETTIDFADRIQSFTFRPNTTIRPPAFVPLLLTGKNDPQGCVFRRKVLQDVGLYEESLQMCEDWALFVKIALQHDIMPVKNCHYSYRQHPRQFCRQRRLAGSFHRDFLPFINWLRQYLETASCRDRRVWAAVSQLTWRNRLLRATEHTSHALKRAWSRTRPESA